MAAETTEVVEATELLLKEFGECVWFYDAYRTLDDAGPRLLVEVIDEFYLQDYLPRRLGNAFVVVVKVPGKDMSTEDNTPVEKI